MSFVNCTPHDIVVTGGLTFTPSGTVARVTVTHEKIDTVDGIDIFSTVYGDVTDLPEPVDGVLYIVSLMVLQAAKNRTDLVAPSTGHPNVVRTTIGHILSVPGFVR